MILLTARYVAPADRPVIENGAVLVQSGRVVAVGRRSELSAESVIDYGDAVICPGFVNAHTHLELSFLAGRIPPGPNLADWLGRLVSTLRTEGAGTRDFGPSPTSIADQSRDRSGVMNDPNRDGAPSDQSTSQYRATDGAVHDSCSPNERLEDSVREGIAQSIHAGVTIIGDITTNPGVVRPVLAAANVRSVSFGEVIAIGTQRGLLTERLDAAVVAHDACDRLRIGVSPHAPYTVEPDGLAACARRAEELRAPLCIHLAESREEEEFTLHGAGPLAEHLKSLGVWDEHIAASGRRPVELADACGLLSSRTVVAHANYVSDADIDLLAARGASVVLCPRTHHAFGHAPHRYPDMLRAGINVCVGTDSLASNPSLSVLDELRLLFRTHEGIDPELVLAMGTVNGSKALGCSGSAGSLSHGAPADLVVVPIEQAARRAGLAAIYQTDAPPRAVYIEGILQNPRWRNAL